MAEELKMDQHWVFVYLKTMWGKKREHIEDLLIMTVWKTESAQQGFSGLEYLPPCPLESIYNVIEPGINIYEY